MLSRMVLDKVGFMYFFYLPFLLSNEVELFFMSKRLALIRIVEVSGS